MISCERCWKRHFFNDATFLSLKTWGTGKWNGKRGIDMFSFTYIYTENKKLRYSILRLLSSFLHWNITIHWQLEFRPQNFNAYTINSCQKMTCVGIVHCSTHFLILFNCFQFIAHANTESFFIRSQPRDWITCPRLESTQTVEVPARAVGIVPPGCKLLVYGKLLAFFFTHLWQCICPWQL